MVRVKFYDAVLDNFLNNTNGEVGRWLKKATMPVLAESRIRVGVRTGALRSSIHMRHSRDPRGQQVWIGSKLNYALAHHEGTPPHQIKPKNGRYLKFASRGRIIYAQSVNHPGSKANRYLSDSLKNKLRLK